MRSATAALAAAAIIEIEACAKCADTLAATASNGWRERYDLHTVLANKKAAAAAFVASRQAACRVRL
ncbi:hypothetical protein AAHK20_01980 [Trinickia sp. YCB016]